MKSAELVTGVSYGIVPSWSYSSRENRDPLKATRNRLLKADLVSMDKYFYEVYRSPNQNDTLFRKAASGERRFGYLVTDGSQYWVARPQDIVDVWVTLEKRWAAEEAAAAKQHAEQQQREERERALSEEADRYADRLRNTLTPLILQITGKSYPIVFSKSYYHTDTRERVNPFITAQLDARLLERLVEAVLEAKEA